MYPTHWALSHNVLDPSSSSQPMMPNLSYPMVPNHTKSLLILSLMGSGVRKSRSPPCKPPPYQDILVGANGLKRLNKTCIGDSFNGVNYFSALQNLKGNEVQMKDALIL